MVKMKKIGSCNGISCYVDKINDIEYVSLDFDCDVKKNTIGCKEGKLICKAFLYATRKKLPIISFVSSGGIRVTEGTLALMQMIKMVMEVKQHSEDGLLYISVIKHLTLGGASASFVSLADIIIGVQGATYGFSGKRIIEDTICEKLTDEFQTVEYAKKHGMVDIVVEKNEVKTIVSKLLELHKK